MGLNIKNPQVERLAEEVARLAGESKTEAIRQALIDRLARLKYRLKPQNRSARLHAFLEREVWSRMPKDQIGRAPSKKERERILGYGKGGV
jgi:antitoxin VapB